MKDEPAGDTIPKVFTKYDTMPGGIIVPDGLDGVKFATYKKEVRDNVETR